MPLELRRWFQVCIFVAGMVIAWICWFFVHAALQPTADGARLVLVILVIAASNGFAQIFKGFLPIILTKIWPSLDT